MRDFAEIESFETLLRNWQVKGMSVRPVHRMVAHSAFIIVARRLADMAAEPGDASISRATSSSSLEHAGGNARRDAAGHQDDAAKLGGDRPTIEPDPDDSDEPE